MANRLVVALVHEAFLRLRGVREMRLENRAHFYGAAVDGHPSKDMTVLPNGQGYQIGRLDGAVIGFGAASSASAPFDPNWKQHPVVGIAARPGGG